MSTAGMVYIIAGFAWLWSSESSFVINSELLAEVKESASPTAVDLSSTSTSTISRLAASGVFKPVYFQSSSVIAQVQDDALNLVIAGALKAERRTEYCQWQEHHRDVCETCWRDVDRGGGGGHNTTRESYACNCKREFYYIKSWHAHRISSLVFDQPAAHWNPQDDPYPSATLWADDGVVFGNVPISQDLVRTVKSPSRLIKWTPGAKRESPQWFDIFGGASSRFDSLERMTPKFATSRAALQDGFVYAGNGWFFHAKLVSVQERLLRALFQYAEGSLLDFQLGDLVPSCEAGDVKFRYFVTDPSELSGVGGFVNNRLGLFTSLKRNAAEIGIVHAGKHSLNALLDNEASELRWWTYGARVVFGLPIAWMIHTNLKVFIAHRSRGPDGVALRFVLEAFYVLALATVVVYSIRSLALRAAGLQGTRDATTAIVVVTVALLSYSEAILPQSWRRYTRFWETPDKQERRNDNDNQGGLACLWAMWTTPPGVFVDGVYSAAATAAAASAK